MFIISTKNDGKSREFQKNSHFQQCWFFTTGSVDDYTNMPSLTNELGIFVLAVSKVQTHILKTRIWLEMKYSSVLQKNWKNLDKQWNLASCTLYHNYRRNPVSGLRFLWYVTMYWGCKMKSLTKCSRIYSGEYSASKL